MTVSYADWLRALAEEVRLSDDNNFYLCHCLDFMVALNEWNEGPAATSMVDKFGLQKDYIDRLRWSIGELEDSGRIFGNAIADLYPDENRNMRRVLWLRDLADSIDQSTTRNQSWQQQFTG